MKRISSFLTICAVLLGTVLCTSGCKVKGSSSLLPEVSGKAGEVIIVLNKTSWEGNLGTEVRDLLGSDTPFLAQREPLYSLVNVIPSNFTNLFKYHRNIVMFDINPQIQKPGIIFKTNVWAQPQCVTQISAYDDQGAIKLLQDHGDKIAAFIEQAERDRIIANSIRFEERSLPPVVTPMIGGSPHFPTGYKLKKKTDDFIWIAEERQYTNQGILIYKYPALAADNFSEENIIAKRNEFLKNNVPGMFDNTYMITSTAITPTVKYIKYKGLEFAETRGFWEVYNDYMGGPFVSHSFYSKDGKDIIVLEAFVYAPKYDKRQYLRQVESIIYSFEWAKPQNSDTK